MQKFGLSGEMKTVEKILVEAIRNRGLIFNNIH